MYAPSKASKDPLAFGPMTRARKLKFKQALISFIEHILKMTNDGALDDDNNALKMVTLVTLVKFEAEAHLQ